MISTCECYKCSFYNFKDLNHTCKAYPKGIPHDIVFSKILHTSILDDQVGSYVFKKLSEKELDKIYEVLEEKESNKTNKHKKIA